MKKQKKGGCLFPLICSFLIVWIAASGLGILTKHLFPLPYQDIAFTASAENELPPALLYALMKAESDFDARAVSRKGAQGLMQLMEDTAVWCSEKSGLPLTDILDPAENISLGSYYLGYLLSRYNGNMEAALAAYNAGHGRVDAWLKDAAYSPDGQSLSSIPFPETERYVKKVMLYQKIYEKRLAGI